MDDQRRRTQWTGRVSGGRRNDDLNLRKERRFETENNEGLRKENGGALRKKTVEVFQGKTVKL